MYIEVEGSKSYYEEVFTLVTKIYFIFLPDLFLLHRGYVVLYDVSVFFPYFSVGNVVVPTSN